MMKGSATPRKQSTTTAATTSSIAAYSAARPRQSEVYEDYSEAVENWRQKREQKRKQSLNSNRLEDEPTTPASTIQPSPPPTPVKQIDEPRPILSLPPPPPPSSTTTVSTLTKTNISTEQLVISNRKKSESPTPQRPKGPARIHEVSIQKPSDVRGFGFKSDGGPTSNRPIYISYIEDGSPADKAGLCVDDEIISVNDENIEQMTFDQVRRILTERNRRGSIKLLVRTFEDGIDDTSQTVTTGHSRTSSPQKILSTSNTNTAVLPTPAPPPPPPPSSSSAVISTPTQTSTIRISSSTPTNVQSPVYTFLPFTPPSVEKPVVQTPTSSLNIFAPKPFRPTPSITPETSNSFEKNHTYSSPIEAFRKMLDPSNSISKSMKNEVVEHV